MAVGGFTSALDQLSVTVALPTISEHFGSDLPTAQWMVVGYGLTVSVMLLPMGRLGDIVGRKQVYLAGFLIFVLCAALAGSSQNIAILIMARVIQGCGAAMIQSTGRAMIKDENVCLHCGLCAERCPTAAWDMQKFYYSVTKAGQGI